MISTMIKKSDTKILWKALQRQINVHRNAILNQRNV